MCHAEFLFLLSLVERDITPQAILGGSPTLKPKSRLAPPLNFSPLEKVTGLYDSNFEYQHQPYLTL